MEELNETSTQDSAEKSAPGRRKVVRIYFIILIALLTGAIVYMLIEASELRKINELTEAQLDQAFSDLDSMSTELDQRILRIAQLGGEIDTLIQIKNQLEEEKRAIQQRSTRKIKDLQGKVDGYRELLLSQDKEIERLKKVNEELLTENTDLKNEANELNESIRALNSDREELENKVAMASRLKIDGLKVVAVATNGKEREGSFRNRHINDLKIVFDVLENRVAPIAGREILLKITAPDGNVLFDVTTGSGTFMFEGRESFFTAKKRILYDRNSQEVAILYNKGTDYAIGKYTIELFTEDYRMGKGEFFVK